MKEILKKLKNRFGHIWVAGYIFIYLPWFCYLERHVSGRYAVMHVALDDYIPFNEYFIVPYLLWFVYVAGMVLYFFLTSKGDYYRLCAFLFVGMTLSLFICTIFPNGTDLRAGTVPDGSIFGRLVQMIRSTDTPTNVFPSIHVYNSIGVHCSVVNSRALRDRVWVRRGSFALMLLICLSTLFLKQHSVIDVTGACVLSYIIYPLVYGASFAEDRKTARQKAVG